MNYDIPELTAWAESDAPFDTPAAIELTGEAAVRAGREFLSRAGRPSLGSTHATGTGRSPRRQVRLPESINTRLDTYATQHGLTASEVIRDALTTYLEAA